MARPPGTEIVPTWYSVGLKACIATLGPKVSKSDLLRGLRYVNRTYCLCLEPHGTSEASTPSELCVTEFCLSSAVASLTVSIHVYPEMMI